MSSIQASETFIFHTAVGPVVTQVQTVYRFDVEDIIRNRATALGRKLQFYRLGRDASPNDVKAERTMPSIFTSIKEELPT